MGADAVRKKLGSPNFKYYGRLGNQSGSYTYDVTLPKDTSYLFIQAWHESQYTAGYGGMYLYDVKASNMVRYVQSQHSLSVSHLGEGMFRLFGSNGHTYIIELWYMAS